MLMGCSLANYLECKLTMSPPISTGSLLARLADLAAEYAALHKAIYDLTQATAGMQGTTTGDAQIAWNRAAALLKQLADNAST